MRRAPVLALAAIALGLTACGKPSDAQMSGTWLDAGAHARLRLNRDGTARLIDWPLSKVFDVDDERRVSARGRWSTANSFSSDDWPHSLWSLDLVLDRIDDGTKIDREKPNGFLYGWCDFWRCIRAQRGDPDSGDELVFFKSPDSG